MENDLQTAEVDSIDAVIDRAVEVIGDREEAMRWLGTPVRALGYATPIAVMSKAEGKMQVIIALSRLEHGVM
jgi:putative toxin-antitoxin system antitoxin component (TIGR02293 family)